MNKKCQVFTPSDYVNKLLDAIDYRSNLYGKKLLENSCGDGNILVVAVQRYIDDCRNQGLSRTRIKNGLSKDITGIEIDIEQYDKCIEKLNAVASKNNIFSVKWNIINADYLKMSDKQKYDYIVGNPPYITYSELDNDEQVYLKNSFDSCKRGKFDYCYAFLEKSINCLSREGKLSYLIPSSVFKTVFGDGIRRTMLPYVKEILDYSQGNVFREALVKSAIIILDKNVEDRAFHYIDYTTENESLINKENLGDKWIFTDDNKGNNRFGDFFKVSHVVATLCNKAFIIKQWDNTEQGDFICGDYIIEKDMIRDAISPRNKRSNRHEKIIFPYSYTRQHKLVRYSEEDLKNKYPGTYQYLLQYKIDLVKRDSDKSALWFEYGRSQALNNLDCEKALISTVISSEVFVYKLDRRSIPYAGMYITPLGKKYSLNDGMKILNDERFLRYVRNKGIPINGNSVRITSKDIENYMF